MTRVLEGEDNHTTAKVEPRQVEEDNQPGCTGRCFQLVEERSPEVVGNNWY